MSERIQHSPERSHNRAERRPSLDIERRRSPERAQEHPDRNAEKQAERVERAREALKATEAAPKPEAAEPVHQPAMHHPLSGIGRKLNYQHTMASVQRQLPTLSRSFSKVIHNPAIERTSEVAAKTVARPSVTAGATTTAVIAGGFIYLFARHYGYEISYIFIPLLLLVGGVVGVVFEGVLKLFRRNR